MKGFKVRAREVGGGAARASPSGHVKTTSPPTASVVPALPSALTNEWWSYTWDIRHGGASRAVAKAEARRCFSAFLPVRGSSSST